VSPSRRSEIATPAQAGPFTGPAIAFDTETKGVDWSDPGQRAFLATFADAGDTWHEESVIHGDLSGPSVWLAHNLSFDWHQLRATWDLDLSQPPYDRVTFHDTDVMARLLFPSGQYDAKGEYVGYKLKQLARVHLDPNADVEEKELDEAAQAIGYKSIKPPKTHRGPWLAYYDVWRAYPDVLLKYALQDARITYDLAAHFIPLLQANDRLWRLYELEMQVTPILVDAERRGTHLDRARVESLYQDYKQREVEVYARLFDEHNWPKESLGGEGSQAALLEHLTETLGIPLYRTTDTGALKTDKYALQEFAGDFPALADFLEWRTIEKFLATYIEPMRDKDDVHPSFYQIGAWTGRMSCSRPNMQNIPAKAGSEVRDVFVARAGLCLRRERLRQYRGQAARLLPRHQGRAVPPADP
jgi:hypothetical protein